VGESSQSGMESSSTSVNGFSRAAKALKSGKSHILIRRKISCLPERSSAFRRFARLLKNNTTLLSLRIMENCTLSEADFLALAQVLSENTTLTELVLRYNHIGNVGCRTICEGIRDNQRTCLITLDLESNGIGGKGAAAIGRLLESNKSLLHLSLSRNKIGDRGITYLTNALQSRQLQTLRLLGCDLHDRGALRIAELLKNTSSLCTLDLSFNLFTNEGAASLSDAMIKNRSLKDLMLSYNSFGKRGIEKVIEAYRVSDNLNPIDETRFRKVHDGFD